MDVKNRFITILLGLAYERPTWCIFLKKEFICDQKKRQVSAQSVEAHVGGSR